MESEIRKLNLGCGEFKKEGFINVDCRDVLNPDVLHNLNEIPYPFPDNQFTLIEADHVLEHLENPFGVMTELHRILADGGKLVIRVPHFSRGFTHADHKRGFDVTFPYYFNPTFKGGYTGTTYELEKMKLTWFSQPYLKKTVLSKPAYYAGYLIGSVISFIANLSPMLCSRWFCFQVGGIEEIEFKFICKKNSSPTA